MRWVPPELSAEGVAPLMLDVLFDTAKALGRRKLPPRASCGVPLERAYDEVARRGLIVVKRSDPVTVSLCDPFELTERGVALLRRYRDIASALGRFAGPRSEAGVAVDPEGNPDDHTTRTRRMRGKSGR